MVDKPDKGQFIADPAMDQKFNPREHIVKLRGGKDYLEVQWRLVWLRQEHPDAIIETELLRETDTSALFKAVVKVSGGGSAIGHGSETKTDFGDFIEKAETKALGRALAAMGYGTQFCTDFDEGVSEQDGRTRIVDSPVDSGRQTNRPPSGAESIRSRDEAVAQSAGATERQKSAIESMCKQLHVDVDDYIKQESGLSLATLTKPVASRLIPLLQEAIKGDKAPYTY